MSGKMREVSIFHSIHALLSDTHFILFLTACQDQLKRPFRFANEKHLQTFIDEIGILQFYYLIFQGIQNSNANSHIYHDCIKFHWWISAQKFAIKNHENI